MSISPYRDVASCKKGVNAIILVQEMGGRRQQKKPQGRSLNFGPAQGLRGQIGIFCSAFYS
jgi:hypothetical protein